MKKPLHPAYVRKEDLPKVFIPDAPIIKFDPNLGTPESFYKYERFGENRPVW